MIPSPTADLAATATFDEAVTLAAELLVLVDGRDPRPVILALVLTLAGILVTASAVSDATTIRVITRELELCVAWLRDDPDTRPPRPS